MKIRSTAAFMILFYAPALLIFIRELVTSFKNAGMPFLQFLGENPFIIVEFFPILLFTVIVVGYAIHFFRAPKKQAPEGLVSKRAYNKPSKKDRLPKRRKDYR
jgi:hypothetical protein